MYGVVQFRNGRSSLTGPFRHILLKTTTTIITANTNTVHSSPFFHHRCSNNFAVKQQQGFQVANFHHHGCFVCELNSSSKILLGSNTTTKPLKFKASSADPNSKNAEAGGGSENKKKTNNRLLFNLTLGFSLAMIALMQYIKYHEAIDPDANNDNWKLLTCSSEVQQSDVSTVKYSLYTTRYHFTMHEFVAMSSNSYITKVEDTERGENLIVLYNPTKLTQQTKQHIESLFSTSLRNTFLIVLPNTEHTLFFGDYYHDYCYKADALNQKNTRVLFLCQKDAKDMFIELARKNIVSRKETSVTTVVNIDPELFMEFGRFSAVSKKEQARDKRKNIVDLVAKHFTIIRMKGIDTRVEESLLYHKASKFLCACDLIMNLEIHTPQNPIVKLKHEQFEPYVLKYSRHYQFAKEMDAPYIDQNMLLDISTIRECLNQAVTLPWNGVGMAHGSTIMIEDTPEGRKREEELKQKWLSSWELKFSASSDQ
nr:unnamed protein product [Naegleria fowleri]